MGELRTYGDPIQQHDQGRLLQLLEQGPGLSQGPRHQGEEPARASQERRQLGHPRLVPTPFGATRASTPVPCVMHGTGAFSFLVYEILLIM